MNKTELVAAIAAKTGQSKADADAAITALCEILEGNVARGGEKVSVPGYFSAERTVRSARTGRNPQTGESLQIPAAYSVKMTPGSKLKSAAKSNTPM